MRIYASNAMGISVVLNLIIIMIQFDCGNSNLQQSLLPGAVELEIRISLYKND